jgi:hypothetical protein
MSGMEKHELLHTECGARHRDATRSKPVRLVSGALTAAIILAVFAMWGFEAFATLFSWLVALV